MHFFLKRVHNDICKIQEESPITEIIGNLMMLSVLGWGYQKSDVLKNSDYARNILFVVPLMRVLVRERTQACGNAEYRVHGFQF